jgi:hypothetical protein
MEHAPIRVSPRKKREVLPLNALECIQWHMIAEQAVHLQWPSWQLGNLPSGLGLELLHHGGRE